MATAMLNVELTPQLALFPSEEMALQRKPFRTQLLKWIGNKQKYAEAIIAHFPKQFGTYYEPFLGSGGVLGVLAPQRAVAGDVFLPLMEIWQTLHEDREKLKDYYAERYALIDAIGKERCYERVLAHYNAKPNGADLLFLCRACYGGVVRFRKADGHMSTPVGIHNPVPPMNFAHRVDLWHERTKGTRFIHADFAKTMALAEEGDLVYCDPPYLDSQTILYGAQQFSIRRLFRAIAECKARGVRVALSIDGTKYSGRKHCNIPESEKLFEREVFLVLGRSMLKRFQMDGQSLEEHEVSDRLLLTYSPDHYGIF
jgi:DNA adenine methylase